MPSSGSSRPTSANDGSVSPIARDGVGDRLQARQLDDEHGEGDGDARVATSTHWITRLACWKVL